MTDKYEGGSHNSMQEYRYHDVGSVLVPVPQEAMDEWTKKIQALIDVHVKPQVNIWKDII